MLGRVGIRRSPEQRVGALERKHGLRDVRFAKGYSTTISKNLGQGAVTASWLIAVSVRQCSARPTLSRCIH